MKICKRAVDFLQITDDYGSVRQCSWLYDGGIIGNLLDSDIKEIYHGERAQSIRERLICDDYSNCNPDSCPYIASGKIDKIAIDEIPEYPESLYLAYDNICNYKCVMCSIPGCISTKANDIEAREKRLDKIDERVREILPYVKNLGAHGLGELFASKRIMRLLSEWKPLADPSEIKVSLETNGSLFNEKNWEKIANLGQYDLHVSITILSFDPDLYQELSGTSLPLSNLINNLYFVKSLREKGVINNLELATVVQDRNFREMPEFARKCVEEFGADYVRLRPYEPWTSNPTMQDWIKDVRNEYHPYNKEYLKVMSDPYLNHPKVHDWSGGQKSKLGPEPYKKLRIRYSMIEKIINDEDEVIEKINSLSNNKSIVVYGLSVVGKLLIKQINNNVKVDYIIDRNSNGKPYCDISCFNLEELKDKNKDVTIIIALERTEDIVKDMLKKYGYSNIYTLRDIIDINC